MSIAIGTGIGVSFPTRANVTISPGGTTTIYGTSVTIYGVSFTIYGV